MQKRYLFIGPEKPSWIETIPGPSIEPLGPLPRNIGAAYGRLSEVCEPISDWFYRTYDKDQNWRTPFWLPCQDTLSRAVILVELRRPGVRVTDFCRFLGTHHYLLDAPFVGVFSPLAGPEEWPSPVLAYSYHDARGGHVASDTIGGRYLELCGTQPVADS